MIARVVDIEVDREGLYKAGLELSYGEKTYKFKVERLLRKPTRARAKIEGDYIIIYIDDTEGKPLSSCCIHFQHIEKGCVDCKNLMRPPSSC